MCNNLLRSSKQANCIDDLGSFFLGAKSVNDASTDVAEQSPGVSYVTSDKCEEADDPEEIPETAGIIKDNIVNYIGGYVVRKLKTKVVCEDCHLFIFNGYSLITYDRLMTYFKAQENQE